MMGEKAWNGFVVLMVFAQECVSQLPLDVGLFPFLYCSHVVNISMLLTGQGADA